MWRDSPLAMTATVPTCPRCRQPLREVALERVGVTVCETCHGTRLTPPQLPRVLEAMSAELLKWVNADELGAMTLMWARMEARQSRLHAQTENLLDGADSLIRRQRIARVVSNVLFRVLG